MPIIAIILTLEIAVSALLVIVPSTTPQKGTKVLSQSILLADDQNPPGDQSTSPDHSAPPDQATPLDQTSPTDQTPPPSDTTTSTSEPAPAPADTTPTPTEPQPTPIETTPNPETTTQTPSTTTETTSPRPEPSPTETTTTTTQEASPSSSPEAGTAPQETPEQSASTSANLPILNTDELTNNPSQIDTGSQTEVSQEEQQLDQITDPLLKATALTTFASDKISDIDRFTHNEDFNSTIFASQRLSDQIDKLKTLSTQTAASPEIHQKLSDLCQQTNTTLRAAQEVVPEEIEQDMEITRGQCLGY